MILRYLLICLFDIYGDASFAVRVLFEVKDLFWVFAFGRWLWLMIDWRS